MGWFWGGSSSGNDKPATDAKLEGTGGGGGCPVMHTPKGKEDGNRGVSGGEGGGGGCPVPEDARNNPMIFLDPRNNMRAGGESQYPGLGQSRPLSKDRVESTIPRDSFEPAHQKDTGTTKWVYPSEQMFFNAMQRKGWKPNEEDMSSVVGIHNAVNEQTWKEVMRWERELHPECPAPKLVRFYGRPKDFSPRARMLGLMGYKMPFDRHDWTVDRCGKQVRYVIDFYNGRPATDGRPVSFYVEVRPALDDAESFKDRVLMMMKPVIGTKQSDGFFR